MLRVNPIWIHVSQFSLRFLSRANLPCSWPRTLLLYLFFNFKRIIGQNMSCVLSELTDERDLQSSQNDAALLRQWKNLLGLWICPLITEEHAVTGTFKLLCAFTQKMVHLTLWCLQYGVQLRHKTHNTNSHTDAQLISACRFCFQAHPHKCTKKDTTVTSEKRALFSQL